MISGDDSDGDDLIDELLEEDFGTDIYQQPGY